MSVSVSHFEIQAPFVTVTVYVYNTSHHRIIISGENPFSVDFLMIL